MLYRKKLQWTRHACCNSQLSWVCHSNINRKWPSLAIVLAHLWGDTNIRLHQYVWRDPRISFVYSYWQDPHFKRTTAELPPRKALWPTPMHWSSNDFAKHWIDQWCRPHRPHVQCLIGYFFPTWTSCYRATMHLKPEDFAHRCLVAAAAMTALYWPVKLSKF